MSEIQLKVDGPIAEITIKRQSKRNALTCPMVIELKRRITRASQQESIRLCHLKADGDFFCAGADINTMREKPDSESKEDFATHLAKLFKAMYNCPIPLIVSVQGGAYGGALGLLACADIVIAEKHVVFGFTEARIGLIPATIMPYVIHKIGQNQAAKLFITAEIFDSQHAHAIGLVHDIADESLEKSFAKTQAMILGNSPQSLRLIKKIIRNNYNINDDQSRTSADWLNICRKQSDCNEGLTAFLEKRSPNWKEN